MSDVANARINTFGPSPKADFVSTSEQLITLTYGQLQDLVIQAAERAIHPMQDRIKSLEATIARQDAKIAALEATEEHDVSRLALDIAYDRQRLAKLERVEPQPLQKDRGEILRALLVANGGKMLAKDARQKMHLSKQLFSMLTALMSDYIEIKPLHSDNRKKLLFL
jgi:septal ring factor EnvC (AmiA/AmiB activator)